MKTFRILAAMAIAALIVAGCSSAQQAQIHSQVQQFNTNVGADVQAAQPTLKTIACIDAKGAVIAAPALAASGNGGAAAITGAAGQAGIQVACPAGSTPQAQ